ncbi:dynamin family protein [Phytohabitans rumicis]|uniref:Dynamin N-terminal domain-containing protein n=1 Tax=Phytohabitans rumicis TaxID=1076125 RepID=A0A6V8LNU6_9ACTN|nr:dynamin family protein [Phytohabitans rumicis]GFJ95767.1 hypothetical protein Prum_094090 [Phytohabitans rumicis]
MSAPTPSPDALAKLLTSAVDASLAFLRKADPDAAGDLDAVRRRDVGRPSIVVVGETKRGKSSLVNALIGVPALSPVDAAVATAAYLEFVHGPEHAARAWLPGREDPVPLGLADLRDWATPFGRLPEGTRPPRRIEVTHSAPLLQYLSMVDTPAPAGSTRCTPRWPWTRSSGPARCCSWWTPPPRSPSRSWSSSSRPASGSTSWCSR